MSVVSFAAHFANLPDPRIARKRRHTLLDIVVVTLCAVICGAEGWDDIERFGVAKETWFRERLGLSLENGIPSNDTFCRVLARLDTAAFAKTLPPANGAILRHTALNLLRKHPGKRGQSQAEKAGWDDTFLMNVILV